MSDFRWPTAGYQLLGYSCHQEWLRTFQNVMLHVAKGACRPPCRFRRQQEKALDLAWETFDDDPEQAFVDTEGNGSAEPFWRRMPQAN